MSERTDIRQAAHSLLNPDEVEGVLSSRFYDQEKRPGPVKAAKKADKPTHYKVICISMYTEDLGRLDKMVDELKARGMTKANRSALIRYALDQLDLETVPRGL